MTTSRQDASESNGTRAQVSIVVPCYNGGHFLPQLLDCFARQTFADIEFVIVDDGSTDAATRQVLQNLDSAIRVVRQDNKGLSAARNAGIAAARTELVMVIDCDDMIEPPFLEEAVPILRRAPPDVAMVLCHKRLVGEAGGNLERHFNRFDLLFTNPIPSGLLLRKSSWQAAGGYDETMRDGYEDWEFYLRLMRMGFRGVTIPKPYLVYHVSSQGMLFNQASGKHAAIWRRMRCKHAPAYRPLAMLRLWRASRDGSGVDDTGQVSLIKAVAAYLMAVTLPDGLVSRLVALRRKRHLLGGQRPTYVADASRRPHVTQT